jgi:hypothetical protein
MPIIPALQEVEIKRIMVSLGKKFSKTPSQQTRLAFRVIIPAI